MADAFAPFPTPSESAPPCTQRALALPSTPARVFMRRGEGACAMGKRTVFRFLGKEAAARKAGGSLCVQVLFRPACPPGAWRRARVLDDCPSADGRLPCAQRRTQGFPAQRLAAVPGPAAQLPRRRIDVFWTGLETEKHRGFRGAPLVAAGRFLRRSRVFSARHFPRWEGRHCRLGGILFARPSRTALQGASRFSIPSRNRAFAVAPAVVALARQRGSSAVRSTVFGAPRGPNTPQNSRGRARPSSLQTARCFCCGFFRARLTVERKMRKEVRSLFAFCVLARKGVRGG